MPNRGKTRNLTRTSFQALIATGMDAGAIRIGVLMVDDEPVAAQLWIVWNRRATIFKLSYAERFARFSPARS